MRCKRIKHEKKKMTDGNDKDIDAALRKFESTIDKSDPEQVKLLEEMREHTRRLHQIRGDWNKSTTFRNWNDPSPRSTTAPPLSIESYRSVQVLTIPMLSHASIFFAKSCTFSIASLSLVSIYLPLSLSLSPSLFSSSFSLLTLMLVHRDYKAHRAKESLPLARLAIEGGGNMDKKKDKGH